MTTKKTVRYLAYLVRLWQVDSAERSVWRASIEDPHTGERRGFGTLSQLFEFLRDRVAESDPAPRLDQEP